MDNWNKIEFIFCHKLHVSPIDLQQLEFYRIQYILKEFEEYVDKENREYEKQQKMANAQTQNYKSSTSNFGGFKIPEFKMPNINPPKL